MLRIILELSAKASSISTLFLSDSVSHSSGCSNIVTFQETEGLTSEPRLAHFFRNALQSTWECHLPRSNWPSQGDTLETPTYPVSMRIPAPPLGLLRANRLSKAGALLPESSSINLKMPFTSFKLAIPRKFFRYVTLSWINENSCTTARLT